MNEHDLPSTRDSRQSLQSARAQNDTSGEVPPNKFREPGRETQTVRLLQDRLGQDPGNSQLHVELGTLLVELNRHEEAIGSFLAAHQLKPNCAEICDLLGVAFAGRGLYQPAAAWFERGRQIAPTATACRSTHARVLMSIGRSDEAARVFEEWVAIEPDNPIAKHLAAAILGRSATEAAPVEYVRKLFDDYSKKFDASLARLNYRGPGIVLEVLETISDRPVAGWDILDVGCGTGLVGATIRPLVRRLAGVDLSAEMLAIARDRGVYDELVEAELIEYLRTQSARFDILTAADVLPYLGELSELFRFSAQALRPGGWVIVMVEAMDGEGTWKLNSTGRYCHSREYLRTSLERAGFTIRDIYDDAMRCEARLPVSTLVAVGRMGLA